MFIVRAESLLGKEKVGLLSKEKNWPHKDAGAVYYITADAYFF